MSLTEIIDSIPALKNQRQFKLIGRETGLYKHKMILTGEGKIILFSPKVTVYMAETLFIYTSKRIFCLSPTKKLMFDVAGSTIYAIKEQLDEPYEIKPF